MLLLLQLLSVHPWVMLLLASMFVLLAVNAANAGANTCPGAGTAGNAARADHAHTCCSAACAWDYATAAGAGCAARAARAACTNHTCMLLL